MGWFGKTSKEKELEKAADLRDPVKDPTLAFQRKLGTTYQQAVEGSGVNPEELYFNRADQQKSGKDPQNQRLAFDQNPMSSFNQPKDTNTHKEGEGTRNERIDLSDLKRMPGSTSSHTVKTHLKERKLTGKRLGSANRRKK